VDEASPPEFERVGVDFQTNPSIWEDNYLIRTVNYDLDEGFVRPPDSKTHLVTRNGTREIDYNPRPLIFSNGLEDGRLIRWNGRLCGLFSGHYQSEGRWVIYRNTMILVDLESMEWRSIPTEKREKNWMPFVEDGHLRVIYSTSPLEIWDISERLPEVVYEGPGLTEFWSGGSQMIPYQGGYLGVVHRHKNRVYEHAFLAMDGRSLELSPAFRFFGSPVEFCAGLSEDLCLSFGVQDKEGYLCSLRKSEKGGTGRPMTRGPGSGATRNGGTFPKES